jgi:hypothetical protein
MECCERKEKEKKIFVDTCRMRRVSTSEQGSGAAARGGGVGGARVEVACHVRVRAVGGAEQGATTRLFVEQATVDFRPLEPSLVPRFITRDRLLVEPQNLLHVRRCHVTTRNSDVKFPLCTFCFCFCFCLFKNGLFVYKRIDKNRYNTTS